MGNCNTVVNIVPFSTVHVSRAEGSTAGVRLEGCMFKQSSELLERRVTFITQFKSTFWFIIQWILHLRRQLYVPHGSTHTVVNAA